MQRHCTLPLRDPDAAQYVTQRDDRRCPVLQVPQWYWDAVRVDEWLREGVVSPSDLLAHETAEVVELRRAREILDREDREWRARKRQIKGSNG